MGCHLSPEDIKVEITYKNLINLLNTGRYSIDWWEAFELNGKAVNGYYIRARHVNKGIIDPSFGGVCALLTDNGCSLCYEDRPKGGRFLISDVMLNCKTEYEKFDSAKDWSKYWDILNKLFDKFYNI
jgi:hypothetical protein